MDDGERGRGERDRGELLARAEWLARGEMLGRKDKLARGMRLPITAFLTSMLVLGSKRAISQAISPLLALAVRSAPARTSRATMSA